MKNSAYYIIGLAVASLLLSGCNKDNWSKPTKGGAISFSASKVQTKTVYDDSDDLQINWVSGDKIKIYCAEAETAKEASYSVSPKTTKKDGSITCISSESLKWGGDTDVHNFYAVYPASSAVSVSNGIATCTVPANQVCVVRNDSAKDMVADPDMNNAYMVSYLSTAPVDVVQMNFSPIMTTLKITIKARTDDTQGSSAITGISIATKTSGYSSEFRYDIKEGKIIPGNQSGTVTTFVGVKKQNGETFVDLSAGETLTLTAFIPPVDINAENPVSIRLHAQNSSDLSVSLGKTSATSVTASSKRSVILPNIPSEVVSGNNWITPLDDNIYVSQLSMPGTHDSAAYGTTLWNAGQTQAKTVQEQLEMGIRAFDFRPAYCSSKSGDNKMWMYHGATACEISLNNALTTIKTFLDANPGELVFIQYRHESDKIAGLPWDKYTDSKYWNQIANLLNKYTDYIAPFKRDLTVGEARKQMIMITRNDFDGREGLGVGLVQSFPDNNYGVASIAYSGGSAEYHVQDRYKNLGTNSATKITMVKEQLDRTAAFVGNDNCLNWAANYTSGYAKTFGVLDIGTSEAYQNNAHYVNLPTYNYMTTKDNFGPTGAMYLDWVGARNASTYVVYGDLLPQAIIDNNYKYHLRRKGE